MHISRISDSRPRVVAGLALTATRAAAAMGQYHRMTADAASPAIDLENTNSAAAAPLAQFDVPPLRIVIMVVGTLGDIMPLIDMAHKLQDRYGHVVRIASHDDLRAPVEKAGIRYYSLGSTAQRMAGWGPSFSLQPLVLMKLALNCVDPLYRKLYVVRGIIHKTIKACTEPDPLDADAEPFHADVIISNPMTFGHVVCAEAMSIPLHFFFPNPWVATREYPHSFSGWRFPTHKTPGVGMGYKWTKHRSHFASYRLVDVVLNYTFFPYVNDLRAQLGLRTVRFGTMVGGPGVPFLDIPFTQMWSEALSARPDDWPTSAKVVGFIFWDQKAAQVDEASAEYAPLVAWLNAGEKPVYIGFGSMVSPVRDIRSRSTRILECWC